MQRHSRYPIRVWWASACWQWMTVVDMFGC
jgi:hypothetical protein